MTLMSKEACSPNPEETPSKKKGKKSRESVYGKTTLGLQERWEEMFSRLQEFKRTHGHCLVPNRYVEDPSLGAWVSTQRRQYKILISGSSESTPMTPDRAARLVSIGFVWSTRDPRHVPWETRFRELSEYKKTYGDCLVPIGYKDNVQLSNWVSTQRHEYRLLKEGRSSRMTPGRIQALETIGFVWEPSRGAPPKKRTNPAFPLSPSQQMSQTPPPEQDPTQSPQAPNVVQPSPPVSLNGFPSGPGSNPMATKMAAFAAGLQPNPYMPMGINMSPIEVKAMNPSANNKDPSAAAQLCFAAEAKANDEQSVLNAMKQALVRHQQMAREQQEVAMKQEQLMMQAIRKKQQSLEQTTAEQEFAAQQQFYATIAAGNAQTKSLLPQIGGGGGAFGGIPPDSSSFLLNVANGGVQPDQQQQQQFLNASSPPGSFPPKFNGLSTLAQAAFPQKVDTHPEAIDQKPPVSQEPPTKKQRVFEEMFTNNKANLQSFLSHAKMLGLVPPDEDHDDDESSPKLSVGV